MRSLRCSALATTLVLGTGLLPAAQALAEATAPRPLENAQPAPPTNRFGFPTEGWVVVRYTILANGRTDDVRVIDRMPPQLSDVGAVRAVEAWTFEPATDDGPPIDWHNNESLILFDVDTIPLEPSPFFVTAYLAADALVKAGDADKALTRNNGMLATATSRLVEVGLAEMQNAVIHLALGDAHAAYAAIQRATDPRAPVLRPDELRVALQYRNALELELGDVAGALATFARRQEIEPVDSTDAMVARAPALEEALGTASPIAIRAKILDDYWRHKPTRRTFAIDAADGGVKRIQVECDRRTAELEYAPDSEWTLPAGWGGCTVMVEGSRGAEFVFYEFR